MDNRTDSSKGINRRGKVRRGQRTKGPKYESLTNSRVPVETVAVKKPARLRKRRMVFGGTRNNKPATIIKNKY